MTYEEALAAARRGAALLDEKEPGWREWVNPDTLALEDDCDCVLGQVFGLYFCGVEKLSETTPGRLRASVFGFTSRYRRDEEFRLLTKAWREVLAS